MSLVRRCFASSTRKFAVNLRTRTFSADTIGEHGEEEEFERIDVFPPKRAESRRDARRVERDVVPDPRYKRMATNQDWSAVWPAAKMFNPSTVPLPLHMGLVETKSGPKPRPGKFANPELMKIPNFLHLAPPAIEKHCEALKKFCTQWPEALKTDDDCDKHFPVTITTRDYVHASPSIRDPKARVADLQIKMSSLDLDYHAKDKLKRILGKRYNPDTDLITIVADSCPLKRQNVDYAMYLLTACYFESWTVEQWESDKEQSDWEHYFWEKSPSKGNLMRFYRDLLPNSSEETLLENESVKQYADSVSALHGQEESEELVEEYRKRVEKLLFAQ